MSRPNIEGGRSSGIVHEYDHILRSETNDAGGVEYTIPDGAAPVQLLDAGGSAIDVLLPVEANNTDVVIYLINTGGETLTMKDDSDTNTIAVVATAETVILHCDGTTWRHFGVGVA